MKRPLEQKQLRRPTDFMQKISYILPRLGLLGSSALIFSVTLHAQNPPPPPLPPPPPGESNVPAKQIEEMGPAVPAPPPPSADQTSAGGTKKEIYPPSKGVPDNLGSKSIPPVQPDPGQMPIQRNSVEGGFQNRGEVYVYDPTGRRDPFKPYSIYKNVPQPQTTDQGSNKVVEIPLDPLQRYDLPQFKVIGIIWNTGRPRAMIIDPSGKVHMVSKLQKLGRNNGYIAAIREGEIVVVESFEEQGKIQKNFRILGIKK